MTAAVAGAVAFVVGLLSGVVLGVAALVTLPSPVVLAALAGLVASIAVTGVCAFAGSRREGTGPGRSFLRSVRLALAWTVMILP